MMSCREMATSLAVMDIGIDWTERRDEIRDDNNRNLWRVPGSQAVNFQVRNISTGQLFLITVEEIDPAHVEDENG